MYLEHFCLAQHPFSLTPNTRFFLKLATHQEAFNGLISALSQPGHFVKIIGEVGTGKTMLCRKVLNALDQHRDKFVTAFIPHPILDEEGIIMAIADELQVNYQEGLSYYELLKKTTERIVSLAEEKRRVILFIDESQAMPVDSLKAVYLLTQVKVPERRHLQIVLFGQPEFDNVLDCNALQPVVDEISFSFVLPALDLETTRAYINHRLYKAGYCGPQLFTDKAVNLLFKASRGTPRLINILGNKALLVAYGKGDTVISESYVQKAVDDSESALTEVQ